MFQTAIIRGIYIVLSILLSACAQSDLSDLEAFVAATNARKNPEVKQIPEFKVAPNFFYEPGTQRAPFTPFLDKSEDNSSRDENTNLVCNRPDPNRIRVGLELVPLDSLQMVGTLLDASQTLWGLVVSKSDGTIYRVKTGDYLGNENGKITNISEEKIEVLNLIPDNAGCFIDRQVSIALSSDPIK